MKTVLAATSALLVLACAQAAAQATYGNFGLSADRGADNLALTGRVGRDLQGPWSVEGEAAYFFGADAATLAGFGRASFAVAPTVSVHGRLGYGVVTDLSEAEDFFAYGPGVSFLVSERSRLRADYTVYDAGRGAGVDDGVLSLTYVFGLGGGR